MNLKGTKTEQNLRDAFSGESQARNMYHFFAGQARKEGYVQIANLFEETANNEKEHAKIWFKQLSGGQLASTAENLLAAADGEHHEHSIMYPEFANTAREEGFEELAVLFEKVGDIEAAHEARFRALHENMQNGNVFARDEAATWECLNCGHYHIGGEAPNSCPVCAHPQSFFAMKAENY